MHACLPRPQSTDCPFCSPSWLVSPYTPYSTLGIKRVDLFIVRSVSKTSSSPDRCMLGAVKRQLAEFPSDFFTRFSWFPSWMDCVSFACVDYGARERMCAVPAPIGYRRIPPLPFRSCTILLFHSKTARGLSNHC